MPEPRFRHALLINPPTGLYRRDDRCQCTVEDQTVQVIFPPIDLATTAAVLQGLGCESVIIRDYPAMSASLEDYRKDLKTLEPDFVLVNVVTATSQKDFAALAESKAILGEDKIMTCAKGEYMEAHGQQVLSDHPEIDFGIHGEIEEIIRDFYSGAPLETIPGLSWRKPSTDHDSTTVVCNEGHPLVEDVDLLPIPARHLLDNNLYLSPETCKPITVIHGNRGCPAKCVFCPAGVMSGYRVRYRAPELLMKEIDECVTRYGIRDFLFHGDTFTINKKWLLDLCNRIIESGHQIRWGCNSRVDTIDPERAAIMKKAGCWVVAFGMESGNQEILDYMKKGQQLDRARQAARICKDNGLRLQTFFVIGTPLETQTTLNQTFDFARELDPDFFDFNIAYPLPGTELYDIVNEENLWERSPQESGYANAAIRTRELSSEQLTLWRRRALLKMYLRPRYVARMLMKAGGPRNTLNYLKAGARRLGQLVRA
jgi:anaerobic magnesium-protoporphyrin IX monomethyl ester cyclase